MENIGFVEYEKNDAIYKDSLFTYSEEEKQQNEINRDNAIAVFCPEFIPYRMNIKKSFNLSHVETLLYGFIRFYKVNNSNRFWFTNKQLAEILDCSESNIAGSMSNLISKGLIKARYKIKSGGGKVRFVEAVLIENNNCDLQKTVSRTSRKLEGNNNTLKENTLNYNTLNNTGDFLNSPEFINISEGWKELLKIWIDYKKERRESYKSASTLLILYKRLVELSKDDLAAARKMVEQSMANNWAGLFELKNSGIKKESVGDHNMRVYSELMEEIKEEKW